MKISLKHQTTEHSNAASCKVTEYHLNDPMIDCAIAKISGRYPEAQRVINLECNELAYVFQGEGKVVVNHTEYKLSAGDAVLIEAGENITGKELCNCLFLVVQHGIWGNTN